MTKPIFTSSPNPHPDTSLKIPGDQPKKPMSAAPGPAPAKPATVLEQAPGEQGGPKGLEPTRYGDWERKGIVSDF